MKTALVLLADGFEEVEAVTPIDFLRRAGVKVTTLAIGGNRSVLGGHEITIMADGLIESHQGLADAIIVPGGGGGSRNLAASAAVGRLIQEFQSAGKLVAAICAAPAVVLSPLGLLAGKEFTCFPGMETGLTTGKFSAARVVRDGQLITSRGAGTAAEFAEAIIAALVGDAAAREIHTVTVQPN